VGASVEVDESWHFAIPTRWQGVVLSHESSDISVIRCTAPPDRPDQDWSWWVVGKGYSRENRHLRVLEDPAPPAQPTLWDHTEEATA
jgi:hypothetical protein